MDSEVFDGDSVRVAPGTASGFDVVPFFTVTLLRAFLVRGEVVELAAVLLAPLAGRMQSK
jgi:hypothetical protein